MLFTYGTQMKLLLTALFSLFAASSTFADDQIKTFFVPLVLNQVVDTGTYGQDENSSFICYGQITFKGEVSIFDKRTGFNMQCSGTKEKLDEMVSSRLKGTYLGSTLIYKDPLVSFNRTWSIPPRQTAGVLIYWK